jgi:hypothetical protein
MVSLMGPDDLILDIQDAKLKEMVDNWMGVQFPGPLNDIKELMLELALRIRQIRKLAIYGYDEVDGVRYIRASELLQLLE